ncbi:hypothetical protein CDAR_498611 [Caerostris darwini]|uniref:Uncharacterized protein n=1 Tax=Caerostris darwini TaxID=1538125 RepID=A0AAV4SS66_9ARAC|nr:hypothetical protein CDAR_498611 [Caerostris darwini]
MNQKELRLPNCFVRHKQKDASSTNLRRTLGLLPNLYLNVPAEAIKHILCQNHHNRHYVQAANVSFITAFPPLRSCSLTGECPVPFPMERRCQVAKQHQKVSI